MSNDDQSRFHHEFLQDEGIFGPVQLTKKITPTDVKVPLETVPHNEVI